MTESPTPAVWWVNQGRSYEQERASGIVFAGTDGRQLAHHLDVGRMAPGDVVLHYRNGAIVALGEVVATPEHSRRPYGPASERDEGWLTRVDYFELKEPIPLDDLRDRNAAAGPFDHSGHVKQGYLYPLAPEFVDELRETHTERWPPGSPWATPPRRYWLFQAQPGQWDLSAHLPEMPPGHVEDWTVTRHRADMRAGDGVVLWQSGDDAGIYALGRLLGSPELRPTPDFRPTSVGESEHRVDLMIDCHVVPPISRTDARADPVLSALDVLHRPWGGTNLEVTEGQWRAIRSVLPLEPPSNDDIRWGPLVHWAKRIAETVDLDASERAYKLELAERVAAARDAVRSGASGWQALLRRAFASPNNLTWFYAHGRLLDWSTQNPADARAALLALWDEHREIGDAVNTFCAALPISGSGVQANLASYLAAGRGVEEHPVFRARAFGRAYELTEWPKEGGADGGARYRDALRFLDRFAEVCRAADIAPMRDRLDAQGLLWCVLDGKPPEAWSEAETASRRQFLEGQSMDELAVLIEQFRSEADYPADGRPERFRERDELALALTPEALEDPDLRLLRRLTGSAYGSPGPQSGFNRLLQAQDSLGRLCETLGFLLYGPGTVEDRLEDCLSGDHKLPGVGEAMMVKALAVHDPERWIPCYVTRGKVGKRTILELLGETPAKARSQGAAAAVTNDQVRARLEPYFADDPWGMQEFTWWLLHRERVPETPLEDLAESLYLNEPFLERILRMLDDKGQVVFYGPPGTGKTYVAREVAGYIARGGGTVEKVQFHPSYAYEDFVEGYRPRLVGDQVTYEVVPGPLKRIAEAAQERPDVTHVLLIDELNRGNVAKVLGELLFLLEYREEEIRLQYSDEPFSLPKNLRIIATMNTADRSIALVDTALRRRFHFVPFFPDLDPINSLLRRWLAANAPGMAWVADVLDRANEALADRNVAIGPSHFLRPHLDEALVKLVWESSALPFLEEHFFADPDELKKFTLEKLRQPGASGSDAATPDSEADPSSST